MNNLNPNHQQTVAVLRECGYAGAYPGDTNVYTTDSEFRAAERLAGIKASNANVVLALNALECHVAHGVSTYSHAAAATDQVRLAGADDKTVDRFRRKEGEALEEMLAPNPVHELLRRLRSLAKARGLIGEVNGLHTVRHFADQVRAARHMRSVMDRHKLGLSGMAPNVPEIYANIKRELAEHHIHV